MTQQNHPMQPMVIDDGVIRFKENAIVLFLLEHAQDNGFKFNTFSKLPFSIEDRVQFAQLLGYSVSGFGDLNYVPKKVVAAADKAAEQLRCKSS